MSDSKQFPHISLVLGGARSGKSDFAEKLTLFADCVPKYVATAYAGDSEMKARIAAHRKKRGRAWGLIETQTGLVNVIERAGPSQILLVDCLTLWLSNIMHAGHDIEAEFAGLLRAAAKSEAKLVFVSNELGMGLVPETRLGREFRDYQGRLNQIIAQKADLTIFVVAGLPMTLKGALPEGVI